MTNGDRQLVLKGQQILLNEWIVHAENGAPARRADMQPAQFLSELFYMSVVEKCAAGLLFRLGGTEIRRLLCAEPRGRDVRELDTLGGQPCWSETTLEAIRCGRPVFGRCDVGFGQAHFWMRLPICDEVGVLRFVMSHDRIIARDTLTDDMLVPVALDEPLSCAA